MQRLLSLDRRLVTQLLLTGSRMHRPAVYAVRFIRLSTEAEKHGVTLHFNHKLRNADTRTGSLDFELYEPFLVILVCSLFVLFLLFWRSCFLESRCVFSLFFFFRV